MYDLADNLLGERSPQSDIDAHLPLAPIADKLNTQSAINQGAAVPADPGFAVNKAHAHAAISIQLSALAHLVALCGLAAVGKAVGRRWRCRSPDLQSKHRIPP